MDDDSFHRLKGLFGPLGAETNDEAIEGLMDFYEEYSGRVEELEQFYNEYKDRVEDLD